MRPRRLESTLRSLAPALLLLAGCSGGTGPAEHAAAAPVDMEVTPELRAVLERADAVDGEVDGVVSKCPGCDLAMAGKSKYSMQVGEHEVHFCSERCRHEFEDDPAASFLALELPPPEEAAEPADPETPSEPEHPEG